MFSLITIGSNDLARTKAFYDALFAITGREPGTMDAKGLLMHAHRGGCLVITKPIDRNAATGANGGIIGFTKDSLEQAEAWHEAGVANGGTAVEDPPGERMGAAGRVYLAYLRDTDGNKFCDLHQFAG